MKHLLLACALFLGACEHLESQTAAAPPATSTPQPVRVSTCADSFNQSLANLTSAMQVEGNYAMSMPVEQSPRY